LTPNHQGVKALKGTQSTDPNQWHGLAAPFLYSQLDSRRKGCYSIYAGSSTPVPLQIGKLQGTAAVRAFEEVGVDGVVGSGGRDDLREGVDAGRETLPLVGSNQRIAVASPIEPVLVHPVVRSAEEIRVVDVDRAATGG